MKTSAASALREGTDSFISIAAFSPTIWAATLRTISRSSAVTGLAASRRRTAEPGQVPQVTGQLVLTSLSH